MIRNLEEKTRNLEEKQLNYLLSLSKQDPKEILYLLNLNSVLVIRKHEEFLSTKNGFLSILDLKHEPQHMETEIDYSCIE